MKLTAGCPPEQIEIETVCRLLTLIIRHISLSLSASQFQETDCHSLSCLWKK